MCLISVFLSITTVVSNISVLFIFGLYYYDMYLLSAYITVLWYLLLAYVIMKFFVRLSLYDIIVSLC